jgi:molybdate transport system ATP-binding protein
MASLDIDLSHGLRDLRLELTLAVGAETVALVGPSGAGKSSVLRAVAGLLRPERGRIVVDGETWVDTVAGVDLAPERRSVGLVFQEYALFPHLSVRANVAFGATSTAVVDDVLARLRIAGLVNERPAGLSGGERQRVALARALAREPRVLLLDEPLSALDAHTRDSVRGELRDLLAALRLPTVLVTHDFEDAAALADRVGVLVDGRLLQLGTASELVAAPADPFVARFTGATLLHGVAEPVDGLTRVALDVGGSAWTTDPGSGRVALAVHPWEVSVSRTAPDDSMVNHIRAPIGSLVTVGNRVRVRVGPLAGEITTGSAERLGLREGEVVVASFKATAARLIPLAQPVDFP